MVLAAVNEALRAAQELAAQKMGGATAGLDLGALGGLGLPGLLNGALDHAPRSSGSSPSSRSCPGIGNRTAQRLAFHILRASDEDAAALAAGDPRGQGAHRPVRDLLQPRRGPALPDLRGRAARRRA